MRRLAVILPLLWAISALAQNGATINVRLRDAGGGFPTQALFTLWPPDVTAKSDLRGMTSFSELAVGEYRVEANAPGYASVDTSVSVAGGDRLDLQLVIQKLAITLPEVVVETGMQGADVRRFSRAEIHQSAARTLPDFLSETAGLDVRSDGSIGSPQTIRIGGSNSNQVLVLLDGRRLQTVGNGEADLSSIPLDWVEAIEISRGGKTSDGGEAIGGILRINTRRPGERDELSSTADVHPSYTRASILRAAKAGWLSSLLSYCRTQGPGSFKYTVTEDDGNGPFTVNLGKTFRRANADIGRDQFFVKLSSALSTSDVLEASGSMDRVTRGLPGYLAPRLTPDARQSTAQQALNLRAGHNSEKGNLEARVSYQHDWRAFDDSDIYSLVHHSSESSEEWEGEMRGGMTIDHLALSGGLSSARESLVSKEISGGEAARNRWAGWAQSARPVWTSADRNLAVTGIAGIRWEEYGSGQVFLPRLSVTTEQSDGVHGSANVSWSKSYRAPDFYSLFWLDDAAAQGNPNLRPEVSSEWTGRLSLEPPMLRGFRFEADASDQRVSDLIFWRQTFDNRWKPFNLQKASVRTLDLDAEQTLWREKLRFSAGVNWTEARDGTGDRNTGGKYLTFRAPRSYRVALICRERSVDLSVNYRWSSARPVLDTNSKWLRAYQLLDARISYKVRARDWHIEPGLGVSNLLDENYRLVRFAPMPGREVFATIRFSQE